MELIITSVFSGIQELSFFFTACEFFILVFTNPLMTVPRAPLTIDLKVSFMFHSFFNSLARTWYLFFF